MGVDLDAWIDKLKRCEYLAEDELKALCEYVRPLITFRAHKRPVFCSHRTALKPQLQACCAVHSALNGSLRLPIIVLCCCADQGDTGGGVQRAASEQPSHGAPSLHHLHLLPDDQ